MRSHLIADLAIPIELFHYERLRWIEQEDLSEVRAKLQQEHLDWKSGFIDGGLEYLRRYYALMLLDPLNYHAVPAPLDPFCHTHILFSRDYLSFCRKLFGQFMHHQPLPASDARMARFVRDLYDYTYGVQRKLFKDVDREWWPAPQVEVPQFCYFRDVTDAPVREHALLPRSPRRLAVGSEA